jgi:hypothetical protein
MIKTLPELINELTAISLNIPFNKDEHDSKKTAINTEFMRKYPPPPPSVLRLESAEWYPPGASLGINRFDKTNSFITYNMLGKDYTGYVNFYDTQQNKLNIRHSGGEYFDFHPDDSNNIRDHGKLNNIITNPDASADTLKLDPSIKHDFKINDIIQITIPDNLIYSSNKYNSGIYNFIITDLDVDFYYINGDNANKISRDLIHHQNPINLGQMTEVPEVKRIVDYFLSNLENFSIVREDNSFDYYNAYYYGINLDYVQFNNFYNKVKNYKLMNDLSYVFEDEDPTIANDSINRSMIASLTVDDCDKFISETISDVTKFLNSYNITLERFIYDNEILKVDYETIPIEDQTPEDDISFDQDVKNPIDNIIKDNYRKYTPMITERYQLYFTREADFIYHPFINNNNQFTNLLSTPLRADGLSTKNFKYEIYNYIIDTIVTQTNFYLIKNKKTIADIVESDVTIILGLVQYTIRLYYDQDPINIFRTKFEVGNRILYNFIFKEKGKPDKPAQQSGEIISVNEIHPTDGQMYTIQFKKGPRQHKESDLELDPSARAGGSVGHILYDYFNLL